MVCWHKEQPVSSSDIEIYCKRALFMNSESVSPRFQRLPIAPNNFGPLGARGCPYRSRGCGEIANRSRK